MVLKFFLYFLLIASNVFADSVNDLEKFKRSSKYKEILLYIKNNIRSVRIDNYDIIEYKILALEKTGEISEALGLQLKIFKHRFGKENKQIIQALTRKKTPDLDFKDSEKMLEYYSKIALLLTLKFEQMKHTSSKALIVKIKKMAESFINIIREVDQNDERLDTVEELSNRLEVQQELIKSFIYSLRKYPFLSMLSYQNMMKVGSSEILSTTIGTCTGFGLSYKNAHYDWTWENCYILASSNASTKEGNLSYKQDSVMTSGLYGGAGVMFENLSESLSAGITLNYLMSKSDYTNPSGLSLENKDFLGFGANAKFRWNIDNYAISLSLGKILGATSSIFQIQYIYFF